MLRIPDNCQEIKDELFDWAKALANQPLADLSENLLIFPPTLGKSEDLEEKQVVFEQQGDIFKTTNVMGWIGKGDEQITIHSRFDDGNHDHFLHYMLEKVLNVNILDFQLSQGQRNLYDLLVYMYPYYLQNALKQGVYKEYVKQTHNDMAIKGPIDVARHIKQNTPFLGKVAYDTREYSMDNRLTQLVRHTLEFIKINFKSVKFDGREIVEMTPTYKRFDLKKVMRQAEKPVSNPYYKDWEILRQISLQILRRERQSFGQEKDKVYGILFDGAWLWEEYVATLLTEFTHAKNRKKRYGVSLFSDRTRTVYPDFYKKEVAVLDAKYKRYDKEDDFEKDDKSFNRLDLYQVISYVHILNADIGGAIFPSGNSTKSHLVGRLNGYAGELIKIGLKIPDEVESYSEFKDRLNMEEDKFLNIVGKEMSKC